MRNKKTAAGTAAKTNRLQSKAYRNALPMSRVKCRLLVEIRGIAGSILNPFTAPEEKTTSEAFFRSTMWKLSVLQNGHSSRLSSIRAKKQGQRVSG